MTVLVDTSLCSKINVLSISRNRQQSYVRSLPESLDLAKEVATFNLQPSLKLSICVFVWRSFRRVNEQTEHWVLISVIRFAFLSELMQECSFVLSLVVLIKIIRSLIDQGWFIMSEQASNKPTLRREYIWVRMLITELRQNRIMLYTGN